MLNPLADFGKTAQGLARNPLGIIALFIVLVYGIAGLVLTSSVASLTHDERQPLLWFLVGFPVIVLGVFGWLVSSHHRKLYGPQDYKSDRSFLQTLAPDVQRLRLNEEVARLEGAEDNTSVEEGVSPPAGFSLPSAIREEPNRLPAGSGPVEAAELTTSAQRRAESRAAVLLAEELVLRQLESEFSAPARRQVTITTPTGSVSLDGVIPNEHGGVAIEIKLLRHATAEKNALRLVMEFTSIVHRFFAIQPGGDWLFVLAIVCDDVPIPTRSLVEGRLRRASKDLGKRIEVRFYDLAALRTEFGVPAA